MIAAEGFRIGFFNKSHKGKSMACNTAEEGSFVRRTWQLAVNHYILPLLFNEQTYHVNAIF